MSEGSFSADLIVILAIAVFVLYKYRQVLGHKTGHDVESPREKLQQRRQQSEDRVVQLKQYQEGGEDDSSEDEIVQTDDALDNIENGALKSALEDMKNADSSLNIDEFTGGAKMAFEMVMDAFNQDDRTTLKQLLSDDLYEEFDQELAQRAKAKNKPQTTLVSILSAAPVAARMHKGKAEITMRFLTEQIHVVKNEKGEVKDGDGSRIDQVEDEWVFERQLSSRNPNWTITDM